MYFENVCSIEELKSCYKKLARKYHPDAGGSAEIMAEINLEFDQLFKKISDGDITFADAKSARFYEGFKFDVGARYDSNLTTKDICNRVKAKFSNSDLKVDTRVNKIGWIDSIQPIILHCNCKVFKDGVNSSAYTDILKEFHPEDSEVAEQMEEILSREMLETMQYVDEYLLSFRYVDKRSKSSNFYSMPCSIDQKILNNFVQEVHTF